MSDDLVSRAAVLEIIGQMPDGLSKWRRRLSGGIAGLPALTPPPDANPAALAIKHRTGKMMLVAHKIAASGEWSEAFPLYAYPLAAREDRRG